MSMWRCQSSFTRRQANKVEGQATGQKLNPVRIAVNMVRNVADRKGPGTFGKRAEGRRSRTLAASEEQRYRRSNLPVFQLTSDGQCSRSRQIKPRCDLIVGSGRPSPAIPPN